MLMTTMMVMMMMMTTMLMLMTTLLRKMVMKKAKINTQNIMKMANVNLPSNFGCKALGPGQRGCSRGHDPTAQIQHRRNG